ncbi:MAG: hypothetical protein PWR10_2015 [Halanaerobiales bacterium]|nr:hypothetical protein [Halanaerobiales bacterium]
MPPVPVAVARNIRNAAAVKFSNFKFDIHILLRYNMFTVNVK